MEVEETQTQACKFSRVCNGRNDSTKVAQKGGVGVGVGVSLGGGGGGGEQYPDDEDDGEIRRVGGGGLGVDDGGLARLRGWHNSSRICRVSRASGGKDRHSKVWTSRGLRDRRIRLSVATAIQFYDLQDRLGYDQPSKAVEWLIKAAADPISELPSLNTSFPDTPRQPSNEKRASAEQGFDSADLDLDGEPNFHHQQQHVSLSKSACSSTSETSKGSGLSLSRSEIRVNRVKARERARERAAKEKEKENESHFAHHQHNVNNISQSSSFTDLLTGNNTHQQSGGQANLFHKSARQWPLTPMDYFGGGGGTSHSSGFSGQIHHLGNSHLPQSMMVSPFNVSSENNNHPELQHFSFVQDHLIPVAATTQPGGNDYNLNFTISSGVAGYNRGTLQSNSPSVLPHLQRFSPIDGSNVPFFMGTAASAAAPMENHHHHHQQFSSGFDSGLQLFYGDQTRHSDQKGKGKN